MKLGGIFVEGSKWGDWRREGVCGSAFVGFVGDVMKMVSWQLSE